MKAHMIDFLRDLYRCLRRKDGRRVETLFVLVRLWVANILSSGGLVKVRMGGATIVCRSAHTLLHLFRDIWVQKRYGYFDDELRGLSQPVIVDAGANVGVATTYFASYYPSATITAIEPFGPNYELLSRNVANCYGKRVKLINIALGSRVGKMEFKFNESRLDSLSMGRAGMAANTSSCSVNVLPLSTIMPSHVDLLKMDIEGAEADVLTELANSGSLLRITRVIVEYHHNMAGVRLPLSKFLETLEKSEFEYIVEAQSSPELGTSAMEDIIIYAKRRN